MVAVSFRVMAPKVRVHRQTGWIPCIVASSETSVKSGPAVNTDYQRRTTPVLDRDSSPDAVVAVSPSSQTHNPVSEQSWRLDRPSHEVKVRRTREHETTSW